MTHNLLVVGLDDRVFSFVVEKNFQTAVLKGRLAQRQGTDADFHLTVGGVPLGDADVIPCGQEWGTTLIRAHPVIRGGKGGFGALIRAVGNRANRSNNKEACRDLSGRRLRDVNAQKKVSKWLKDEPERKRKRREEKRKRLQQRKTQPKHFFEDQAYMEQLRANEEGMDDALKQGLKRKQPVPSGASGSSGLKKAKLWVGVEDEDMSSEESEGDSEDEQESRDSDQYEVEGGQGSSDSNIEQCPRLNSAGSSDGAVKSKSSEGEEVEAEGVAECVPGPSGLGSSGGAVVTDDICIPPLEEKGRSSEQNDTVSEDCAAAEVHGPPVEGEQQNSEQSPASCGISESVQLQTLETTNGSQDKEVVTETVSEQTNKPDRDQQPTQPDRDEQTTKPDRDQPNRDEQTTKPDRDQPNRDEQTTKPDRDQQPTQPYRDEQPTQPNRGEQSTQPDGDKQQTQPDRDEQPQSSPNEPLDLEDYSSVAELESVGAERLKVVLQSMGLKCGGTLQERAQRLFSTKGKSREELDSSLFAKAGKSRKRKHK